MSLADIAAADIQAILNADGCVVTLQEPGGRTAELRGMQADIAHAVDPETGKTVSLRRCSVALSMRDLALVNMEPVRVLDADKSKCWQVTFAETVGCQSQTFTIAETIPDRTLGCLVLILEFFELAPPPG